MYSFIFIIALIGSCNLSESARILAAFSSLGHADQSIYNGYIQELAKAGHHIIAMTPIPGQYESTKMEKIIHINVDDVSKPFINEYRELMESSTDHYRILHKLNDLSLRLAEAQLKSPQMSSILMHPDIGFDMIITEADVPLFYALAGRYKAPHISITASTGKLNMYEAKGNPNHPILYPDVYSVSIGNMSIFQKIEAVNRHVGFKYEYYYNYIPKCQKVADQLFGTHIKDLEQLEYDIDMLFVTGTPMMIGNRPTVPAIIYVDRLHIKEDSILPEDLNSIIESSKNGVIYFALGANFEPAKLPKSTLNTLMTVFGSLPQTILMKMESVAGLKVPSNVFIRSWFPQQEILAHSNVKLFITHGGPRSVEEAIYFTVPIIGIPFVRNNNVLLSRVAKFDAGVVIQPSQLDELTLKDTILRMIGEPRYKTSMNALEYKVFDQPWTGVERAVWWTEYVLRHNGAKHFRAPAVGVSFWKYFMLDLILIVLVAFVLAVILGFYAGKKLVAYLRRKVAERQGKWKML